MFFIYKYLFIFFCGVQKQNLFIKNNNSINIKFKKFRIEIIQCKGLGNMNIATAGHFISAHFE